MLGSGGMGEVYLAQHPRLPRNDALKILSVDISADPDFQRRFVQEADTAAKLLHPNVVAVHDRGESSGQLWIAMDYVDGTDSAQLLRRYPVGLPPDQVTPIVHGHGFLHRDVKPANILFSFPPQSGPP